MVGTRLSEWLRAKGRRPAWLAKQTGLSTSAIAQMQGDKTNPTLKNLHKIANALGVSMSEFWSDIPRGRRR